MDINNNYNKINSEKNQQDVIIIQKKPLPNLLIPKKTWNIIKQKSQSSENLLNQTKYSQNLEQPIKLKPQLGKRSINRSENQLYRTNGVGFGKFSFKIKNFKKYKNFLGKDYNNRTNYLNNDNYEKKDVEQILLLKIDEIKKELEKNENTFIYNQKIMQKKLEEKEKEIIVLKTELNKEKNNKQKEYDKILNENSINFMNAINQLKKEIKSFKNKNQELLEKNIENENNIHILENKNRENISKINDITQKYNFLIKAKTENILEDEIKQYMDDLNQRINEQQNEINSLNGEISYLNQENRRLKYLTKEIIEARNETEIFFLDALNEAKKDLYKITKEKDKRGYFFPTLKNYYENNRLKVDIRELTPEMREKILRNLFEKINRGYNEKNFKELSNIIQIDLSDNDEN